MEKEQSRRKRPPAKSLESRENQLISLAVNLAEKQLMDGSASSQVITHYLKLGSTKERLEKEIMQEQKKLIAAKSEALSSSAKTEELYQEALKAMKEYGGRDD